MSVRGDEVKTNVNSLIQEVPPVESTLVLEVLLELLVHIVDEGAMAVDYGGTWSFYLIYRG